MQGNSTEKCLFSPAEGHRGDVFYVGSECDLSLDDYAKAGVYYCSACNQVPQGG